MSTKNTVYFPGLNGIRAVAALSVLASHVLQELGRLGVRHDLMSGGTGVTVFFTLSGFLITYLLLQEKAGIGRIDLKHFYLRRLLRIWPLYFVYLGLTIAIFGIPDRPAYLVLYVVFLPNIVFNLDRAPAATSHLWSIGVEEQFYAFWPLVIAKVKGLVSFLVAFIVVLIVLRGFLKIYSDHVHDKLPFSIISSLRFDCMATGALFAIAYDRDNPLVMRVARSRIAPIIFWVCFGLATTRHFEVFSILGDNVIAIATGIFIVSQIENPRSRTLLENPVMSFLGQISYGIYVYHPLLVALGWRLFRYWSVTTGSAPIATTTIATIAIVAIASATILIASISYALLEKPFLKLKGRFTIVTASSRPPS